MATDPIPGADEDFDTYAFNFHTRLGADLAGYGLVVADVAPLTAALGLWTPAYAALLANNTLAASLTTTKNTTRGNVESLVRTLMGRIQANPAVTNTKRSLAGIPIHDDTPTDIPPPPTAPIGTVDTSQRFTHTISFRDAASPNKRGKPAGVHACKLCYKIGGAPPTGPSECTFAAYDTRTPYLMEFDETDANKTVHWILYWVNAKFEEGPCSETLSATVPG